MAREGSDRPAGDDGAQDHARTPDRTPLTQQLGRGLVLVLAVLFAVFALANSQYVDFSWVFGSTEVVAPDGERVGGGVPLILLMVASLTVGVVIGAGAAWQTRRTRARRERRDQGDQADPPGRQGRRR